MSGGPVRKFYGGPWDGESHAVAPDEPEIVGVPVQVPGTLQWTYAFYRRERWKAADGTDETRYQLAGGSRARAAIEQGKERANG
jgi:hypothetical protein